MDEGRASGVAAIFSLGELRPLFDAYMVRKFGAVGDTKVNTLRRTILNRCRAQASLAPGLFSLTVPTGRWKDAFEHGLRAESTRSRTASDASSTSFRTRASSESRTADIFREIFGEAVVERHSNVDPEWETAKSRLAHLENWDAPIVVTTNVQFFESLFAARTSRARKLHNIVNSVVVLDEAQLLPAEFLKPILKVMQASWRTRIE